MIVAVTLADDQIVGISTEHIVLLSEAEANKELTEITMVNGKKFVLKGNVLALCHKFNVSR